MVKTKLRGLALLRIFCHQKGLLSTKTRVNGPKLRDRAPAGAGRRHAERVS
jgi:hypothetical protein